MSRQELSKKVIGIANKSLHEKRNLTVARQSNSMLD